MPAAGKILRGSLSSVSESRLSERAIVNIVINGRVDISNQIVKPDGSYSNTTVFNPPIRVAQNYHINFKTFVGASDDTNNIVSLLIELDL